MPDTINAEAVDVVGASFVVDTIGSDNYPTSKLTLGADGVDDGFVATTNPLPIQPSDGTALQTFTTADLDTGAGTATRILVGLALPASGGPVIGGTSTNPIRTDPTGSTTQPVSGTVTADAGTGTFSVNTAQLGGTAVDTDAGNAGAGTQRVVIASDQAALDVSGATVTVDNAGTFPVQEDGAALTALQLIDDPVFADDAVFTPTSSKVMMAGAIRDDDLTTLSAAEGDAVPLRVGSTGGLQVEADGVVDTGNSTTTPLAGDATFTGEWVDTTNFAHLTLSVFADQDSATDGLKFQWSSDGANVDRSVETSVFANTGRAFAVTMRARFFRVEYDNGSTLQGAFRLGVVLKRHGTGLITRPIDANIDSENFASTTRSVIVGEKPNGEFVNVQTTSSGNFKTSLEEFDNAVLGQTTMANSLPVAIASDQSAIQVDTEMPAAAALQDGSANPSVPAVAGMTHVYNGTNWDRLRGNTSGLDVNDISAGTQTNDVKITLDSEVVSVNNAGTFATQVDSITGANFSAAEATALPAEFVLVAGDDGTDTHPLQTDASGNLNVNIQAGSASGTEFNEDAPHTTGDAGTQILAVRNDAGTSLVDTDGDYAPLQVNASGELITSAAVTINSEYAEDSVHTTGDEGTFILGVRNDTLASLVGTDGDYAPFQVDANGALYVNVAAGSTSGTEFNEDTPHTTGDAGVQSLAVRNDVLASLVDLDGDYTPLQVNASGALYVQQGAALDVSGATVTTTPAVTGGGTEATAQRVTIASDSTGVLSVDDNGGSLTVDGTVTADAGSGVFSVSNSGTFPVQVDTLTGANFTAAEAGALPGQFVVVAGDDGTDVAPIQVDTSGNLKVVSAAALDVSAATVTTTPAVTGGGTEAAAQRVTIANDSTGVLSVDDNGGSLTVDGTVDVGSALPAGTNNIGDVDVATQPSRAATADSVTAKLATDSIQDGLTALTPKFAAIGTATSGDNTIVAAVASKKIRITNLFILAAGDVDVFFKDGTTGNDIIGKSTQSLDLTTNSGFTLPFAPTGWGETASGEALVMNLGGAVRVSGVVAYVEV